MSAPNPAPTTITVTLEQLAKMIDHSLLQPTMTDQEIDAGLAVSREYGAAAACVKPYSVRRAADALKGTSVLVCAVVGFPHGNSTTDVKVYEARAAVRDGAKEIDVVVNVGKVLGNDWNYVEGELHAVNDVVVAEGAILKVIFENDFLEEHHIVRLCDICTKLGVAFVKTSTGYGFVKQPNGFYTYNGATVPHITLMRRRCGPDVQIKAAGGVRTLDDLLHMMSLGVTRIGATATVSILEEAKRRGIGNEPVEVEAVAVKVGGGSGGAY